MREQRKQKTKAGANHGWQPRRNPAKPQESLQKGTYFSVEYAAFKVASDFLLAPSNLVISHLHNRQDRACRPLHALAVACLNALKYPPIYIDSQKLTCFKAYDVPGRLGTELDESITLIVTLVLVHSIRSSQW